MTTPAFHLCIVQPLGETGALRLLEPALRVRGWLERLGVHATIAKHRLVHGAVNLVFGAQAEFDPALRERYCCVFVNLEPFDEASEAGQGCLELLRTSPVLDFDPQRVAALPAATRIRFLDDSGVPPTPPPGPPAACGADVYVLGGDAAARARTAAALRAGGLRVLSPDAPPYGPERDAVIRDACLVLDVSGYLDEPLAAHVLGLGTPYARWQPDRNAPLADGAGAIDCVAGVEDVRRLLDASRAGRAAPGPARDAGPGFAGFVAGAARLLAAHVARRGAAPWQPSRINVGSGRDYLPGWLNLDIDAQTQPDALLDLGRPLRLPLELDSLFAGPVRLDRGACDLVFASNVLEHVPDLVCFATQVLALLRTGGDFLVEVPYEHAPEAWQDPTHVRAMNENSWKYFTAWFWYLGWFEHRFELADMQYLDEALEPCGRDAARFMRVLLRKVETTAAERMAARSARPDFGGLLPPLHPHVSGRALPGGPETSGG